jgi:hypothetical protein
VVHPHSLFGVGSDGEQEPRLPRQRGHVLHEDGHRQQDDHPDYRVGGGRQKQHVGLDMNEGNDLYSRFVRLRGRFHDRDSRMAQVKAVREGRVAEVAPDLFPTSGPFQQPIVANMIDVAARDMAEKVAPLPSFNCASPSMLSETARKRASLKTKVAVGYVTNSNLQVQMYDGADKYVTYGFLPIRVEADYETNMPFIRVLDPMDSYPEIDRFGRVRAFFQRALIDRDEFLVLYPEYRARLNMLSGRHVEVIFYHDAKQDAVLLAGGGEAVIVDSTPNLVGKCLVRVASRPGVTDVPRGQFDDVLFVQLAKARFALLALQAAHESVNAPLIVPSPMCPKSLSARVLRSARTTLPGWGAYHCPFPPRRSANKPPLTASCN